MNASAVGAGYTALLEEANRSQEGTQKQLHFLISLEFTLLAEQNATLVSLKKNQPVKKWYYAVEWWCCWGGGWVFGHTDPHSESATEVENNERFSRSVDIGHKISWDNFH